jgi:hypothetical protein
MNRDEDPREIVDRYRRGEYSAVAAASRLRRPWGWPDDRIAETLGLLNLQGS